MNARTRQNQQGLKFLGAVLLITTLVGWIGYTFPLGNEPIVGALIWTGRLAFLIFLVPLFARPLRQLYKTTVTATLDNPPTEEIMVIVGAMGLALAVAMLVTSFPAPTQAVGPKVWKWVHKSGFYVFMFIYFYDFYDFVLEPILVDRPTSHLFWAVLTVAGMTIRSIVLFTRSSTTQATA